MTTTSLPSVAVLPGRGPSLRPPAGRPRRAGRRTRRTRRLDAALGSRDLAVLEILGAWSPGRGASSR